MDEVLEKKQCIFIKNLYVKFNSILNKIEREEIPVDNPFSLGKSIEMLYPNIMNDITKGLILYPDLEDLYSFKNTTNLRLRLVMSCNEYRSATYNSAKMILTIMYPRNQ